MKRRLVLMIGLIWMFSLLNAYGQSKFEYGFLVSNDNDTIYGLIGCKGDLVSTTSCKYKSDKASEIAIYKPEEIIAYKIIGGKYFESKTIKVSGKEKRLFLEFLINGIVDIYFYRDINGGHYYINSDNGELIELNNDDKIVEKEGVKHIVESKEYIGILKYTFKESPTIVNKVDYLNLNHKSLIRIASDYHNQVCPGEKCFIYEKTIEKENLIGFLIGINGLSLKTIHTLDNDYFINSNFGFDIYPSIGVLYNTNLPDIDKQLYVQFHEIVSVTKCRTSHSYYNDETNNTRITDINFNLSLFSSSIGLKYSFTNISYLPNLLIGGFGDFILGKKYFMETKVLNTFGSIITESERYNSTPFDDFDYGFYFGLGYNWITAGNKKMFVDFKYKKGFGIMDGLNSDTYSINLGMQFDK